MPSGLTISGGKVTIRFPSNTGFTFALDDLVTEPGPFARLQAAALAANVTTFGDLANATKRAAFLAALDLSNG